MVHAKQGEVMDEQQALAILGRVSRQHWFPSHGAHGWAGFSNAGTVWFYPDGAAHICSSESKDKWTADELEALAWYMRNKVKG